MPAAIEEEIRSGESRTLELKEAPTRDARKYVKTAVAFSNTHGGKIVFGVSDDRRVVGVEGDPFAVRDRIVDTIENLCCPRVNLDSYVAEVDGRSVVVVEVPVGRDRPYYLRDEGIDRGVYVRIAASTRQAEDGMLRDLLMEGQNRSFDRMDHTDWMEPGRLEKACGHLADVLSRKLGEYVSTDDLAALGLLRREEGGLVPTRGLMLLADNPYPDARIECACMLDDQGIELGDRRTLEGPLIEQAESAVRYVLDHLSSRSEISGLYRNDIYEIPQAAVREFVVNAVTHRSYSLPRPIRVAVWTDRVEVTSPGMMPGGMTVDGAVKGCSNPRNPLIARVFREAGLSEGWGTGIRRSIALCASFGLREPLIEEVDDSVRATIFRKQSQAAEGRNGGTPVRNLDHAVLDILEEMPDLTLLELNMMLNGVSQSELRGSINRLKALGLLSRTGSKKTGHWTVIRNP